MTAAVTLLEKLKLLVNENMGNVEKVIWMETTVIDTKMCGEQSGIVVS